MARWFIARHGETVFNAAARMQGDALHTPLTRAGFAQAEAMGEALRRRLGPRPRLDLWASDTGRALQTLAVIAEHLELDWHQARTDPRLGEVGIGAWSERYYRDVAAEQGPILDLEIGLFCVRPPGGESYAEVAVRGMLTGAEQRTVCGAPVADGVEQGSVVEISAGVETIV